jgi:hypothetical protein
MDADPLATYVELLLAPLVGNLPAADRERIREETEFHLERLQANYALEGYPPEEAMRRAIRNHGDPGELAARLLEMQQNETLRLPWLRSIGYGPFTAFVVFAAAQFVTLGLFQVRILMPSGAAYRLPLAPGGTRAVFPEPLPFPETPLDLFVLYGVPVLFPILGGFVTGGLVRARAARSVALAMLPLVLYAFVVGTLLLPATHGLALALFQFAFWLPVGALGAHLGSLAAQARRARREARGLLGD